MNQDRKIEISESDFAHLSISDMFEDHLLQCILTLVQDGISFLSPEMDILYANPAMRFWYEDGFSIGKKCYEIYHKRSSPCEKCPVLKSLKSQNPEVEELLYEKNGKRIGWQRVFSMPISNRNNGIMMIIEYVQDITNEMKSNLSVELLQNQMNSLIEIMEQKEEERKEKEKMFFGNINKSIDVVLQYLNKILDQDSYDLVKRQLELLNRSEPQKDPLSSKFSGHELTVARYVSQGYMSKEIADKMNLSKKTVDYYRTNIRKKMDLKPDEDLRIKLQKLSDH